MPVAQLYVCNNTENSTISNESAYELPGALRGK